MEYCMNCASRLPEIFEAFCQECGSRVEPEPSGETVSEMVAKQPTSTNPAIEDAVSASTVFLENACLGLTRWWRWVLGTTLIFLFWILGAIPFQAACVYLINSSMSEFRCDGGAIVGDSLIPNFILQNYMFIIGIIGVWLVLKVLHKKALSQTITGRPSLDYNRILYALWIGLGLQALLLVIYGIPSNATFQVPNFWEYLVFFLFAIVLTPYQAAFEEILVRGYLTQGISLITKNKLIVVMIPAIVFSSMHLLNPEPFEVGFVPYLTSMMIFAVFMAMVTLLDGGIELAIGYHAINNLWIFLVFNTDVTVMATPSLFVTPLENIPLFPDIFFQIALLALMIIIFNRKYRWFSWDHVIASVRSKL